MVLSAKLMGALTQVGNTLAWPLRLMRREGKLVKLHPWYDFDILAYEEAVQRIRATPELYRRMEMRIYRDDPKHGYRVLRLAVANDLDNLYHAKYQGDVPVDLLLDGLRSPYIWNVVLKDWKPYAQQAFKTAYPKESEFIELMKVLGHSPEEACSLYKARTEFKAMTKSGVVCDTCLPDDVTANVVGEMR